MPSANTHKHLSQESRRLVEAYRELNLPLSATYPEARQAYRRCVRQWHPDRFPVDSDLWIWATEKLKDANAAYAHIQRYLKPAPRPIRMPARPLLLPIGEGIGRIVNTAQRLVELAQGLLAQSTTKQVSPITSPKGQRFKNSSRPLRQPVHRAASFKQVLHEVARDRRQGHSD